jgi:hypothetical protein
MKITQTSKPFQQVIWESRISKPVISLLPILGGT